MTKSDLSDLGISRVGQQMKVMRGIQRLRAPSTVDTMAGVTTSVSQEEDELLDFLLRLGLDRYCDLFEKEGITSIAVLKKV